MSYVNERIRRARTAAGLNQTELAAHIGVTRAAVSQWELGTTKSPNPKNIFAIAEVTGFSPQWLATGEGPEKLKDGDFPFYNDADILINLEKLRRALHSDTEDFALLMGLSPQEYAGWLDEQFIPPDRHYDAMVFLSRYTATPQTVHDSNVEVVAPPESNKRRMAPVISAVQAGEWGEAEDPFPVGHADEWEPVNDNDGPNVFWLKVKGDSMQAQAGLSIPEGHLIKVDPSKPFHNGSLVVAKLTDSNEATFKKYVEDAGKRYLKPLNPSYPVIEVNGNCRIVGVVTEAKVKL